MSTSLKVSPGPWVVDPLGILELDDGSIVTDPWWNSCCYNQSRWQVRDIMIWYGLALLGAKHNTYCRSAGFTAGSAARFA
ncbi:hypothetical protein SP19_152 [Salmonella phage 19]|nr:hypothetical protein SP19_152 [Salmonella phage 19]